MGAPYRGRMDVISCKRLTKRFESAVAVSNLDLDVSAGQVYGFLGPNGAGKFRHPRMPGPAAGAAHVGAPLEPPR